jgi:hypothetical protein
LRVATCCYAGNLQHSHGSESDSEIAPDYTSAGGNK